MNNRWLIGITGFFTLTTIGWFVVVHFPKEQAVVASVTDESPKITALGRLEPASEVVNVSIPGFLSNDRVAELKVKQGDRVKKGDIIALIAVW